MDTSLCEFPCLQMLTAGLTLALRRNGRAVDQVNVIDREPSVTASTFPSEIVTCRIDGGGVQRLYCKYAIGYNHGGHDHRRGLKYEAEVYRSVLEPLQTTTPAFCGVYADSTTGETWLILEYLDHSMPLNQMAELVSLMSPAARWIGEFHSQTEGYLASTTIPGLIAYDAEYYCGWADRTLLFARDLRGRYPWLEAVCQKYKKLVDLLLVRPATIIHGEFESDNLLFRDGVLYPVDWESTAIAAGEMDLARLTWGWPADIAKRCELEYQQARWPKGAPSDFGRRVATARLYLPLRFLGEQADWTIPESSAELFGELRSAGEQLDLI
jgi:hypothetical protein